MSPAGAWYPIVRAVRTLPLDFGGCTKNHLTDVVLAGCGLEMSRELRVSPFMRSSPRPFLIITPNGKVMQ